MENKIFEIHDGDVIIHYQESEEQKQAIYDAIINWCEKYNCGSGESLMQNDDCLIYAPELLADIIDNIMNFEYRNDEEV